MNKVELVFIPGPGMSHLVPMIEFAKRLSLTNNQILITLLLFNLPNTKSLFSYAHSLAISQPEIKFINIPPQNLPPEQLLKSPAEYIIAFYENHTTPVKEIISNLVASHSNSDTVHVGGVVLDFFCMSMVDVAKELHLSSYVFMVTSAAFLSFLLYLDTRHDNNISEPICSNPELLISGFRNPVPQRVVPHPIKDGSYMDFVKLAEKFREAKAIIVNSFEELENYAFSSFFDGQTPPVFPVGPIISLDDGFHSTSERVQRDEIMTFLDQQPPFSVVLLCFGSLGSFKVEQVREIAVGLEQSGQRFLLSCKLRPAEQSRPFELSGEGAMNEEVLPEGFLERVKGKGMLCSTIAQVEVLSHKAIGGFISHCGWNSILESLWYGVPMATWPLYAEQQLNAFVMSRELELAVEMRLDSGVDGDLVMAEEIESAVKSVMEEGGKVREKIKAMGEMGRKAVMNGGSSFISLERFSREIVGEWDIE